MNHRQKNEYLHVLGTLCEINLNECSSHKCENGGSCIDGIDGYTCSCGEGYTGVYCEEDIDECQENPCIHAISCNNTVSIAGKSTALNLYSRDNSVDRTLRLGIR